jgi:hypothetical protein
MAAFFNFDLDFWEAKKREATRFRTTAWFAAEFDSELATNP